MSDFADLIENSAVPVPLPRRQVLINAPGFYPSITPEQYFMEPCPEPALTASGIKTLLGKPAAEFAENHPAIGEPAEKVLEHLMKRRGDIVHQLALGKGRGYRVDDSGKRWDRRNAEVAAFLDGCIRDGVTPIKKEHFEPADKAATFLKIRIAMTLAAIGQRKGLQMPPGGWSYETEVVVAAKVEVQGVEVWVRCMMDVWCEPLGVILDPKLTSRLYDDLVDAHRSSMGWDMQEAFYKRVVSIVKPDLSGRLEFGNILILPDEPFRSRAVGNTESTNHSCDLEIDRALLKFAEHVTTKKWPDFPVDIERRAAPTWVLRQRMEAELEGEED